MAYLPTEPSGAGNQPDRRRSLWFRSPPYINPKIVEDLSSWVSEAIDSDQIVAIDVAGAQHSNRYALRNPVEVRTLASALHPRVCVSDPPDSQGISQSFCYEFIGETASRYAVLKTYASASDGMDTFTNVLIVTFSCDKNLEGKNRLLLTKMGEFALPLGAKQEVKLEDNRVVMSGVSRQTLIQLPTSANTSCR